MKAILIILGATLLSTGVFAQKKAPKEADIVIQTSAVCDMCKETMESELIYEKGIKKVVLDLSDMKLHVTYDPRKTDSLSIKNAIAALGYDADEVPATEEGYRDLHPCCKKDAHE